MENNTSALSKIKAKSALTILTIMLIGTIAFSPLASCASPPYPTDGSAVVNGDFTEWDLTNDFFANMYRAFDDDKQLQSKLYLRYDMATQTLFVLVLTEPAYPGLRIEDDAWFDVWVNTESDMPGKELEGGDATFAWVEFDPAVSSVKGFEGSLHLAPGEYTIKAHIQVSNDGVGSETSGTLKAGLDLFVVPEGSTILLMGSLFAAFALFAAIKKRKLNLNIKTLP